MDYICNNCNKEYLRPIARCNACGLFDTVVNKEETGLKMANSNTGKSIEINDTEVVARNIQDLETSVGETVRINLSSPELDKFVGNGLTVGSVNLISGEPGVGKSTFLLQFPSYIKDIDNTFTILYISGEESEQQIGNRLRRLGLKDLDIKIYFTDSLEKSIYAMNKYKPKLVIIDSIQTLASETMDGIKGGISQTKYCLQEITKMAKSNDITVFIVGHVTKDGDISGSKYLEHMVDAVFFIEGQGERGSQFKTLKAFKNRYGSTQEIVCFEMEEVGIKIIEPTVAARYFIQDSTVETPGCALGVVKDGNQLFLTEIQSLVSQMEFNFPKRVITAFQNDSFSVLTAILKSVLGVQIADKDVYVNIINNSDSNKVDSLDLPILASIISKIANLPLKDKVFIGKVGLLGEVRAVDGQKMIIKSLKNLGFNNIISSDNLKNIKDLRNVIISHDIPAGV